MHISIFVEILKPLVKILLNIMKNQLLNKFLCNNCTLYESTNSVFVKRKINWEIALMVNFPGMQMYYAFPTWRRKPIFGWHKQWAGIHTIGPAIYNIPIVTQKLWCGRQVRKRGWGIERKEREKDKPRY